MLKKADIVLFVMLCILGLGLSWLTLAGSLAGEEVRVTVDGQLYGVYDLSRDQEIVVSQGSHTNHITIKAGVVAMTSSTCRNQVCVQTGGISQTRDVIVCLPNRVLVEIVAHGGKGDSGDVITG